MEKNFATIDIREAFAQKPQEIDFVIPGLQAGDAGALVSCGGTGKSFFALNIAVAVSTGYDLSGGALAVKTRGKVIYLAAEEGVRILNNRMSYLGQYLTCDIQNKVCSEVTIQSIKGINFWLMDENGKPVKEAVETLMRISKGKRLVILDTLRRFHLGDENSSKDMSQFISLLEGVANATGAAFLYCHHSSKSAATDGKGGEQGASRGSSVLVDNARFQANLVSMTRAEAKKMKISDLKRKKLVKLIIPKINYSEPICDTWLYRNVGGILTAANQSVPKHSVNHTGFMEFYKDMQDGDGDC